jgi:hypothetical protein
MKVVRLSALRTGRLYPQEIFLVLIYVKRLSRPQGQSATGRIMSMKISSDTIRNRTRDLPVCSALPQPLRHCVPQHLTKELLKISRCFYYLQTKCHIFSFNRLPSLLFLVYLWFSQIIFHYSTEHSSSHNCRSPFQITHGQHVPLTAGRELNILQQSYVRTKNHGNKHVSLFKWNSADRRPVTLTDIIHKKTRQRNINIGHFITNSGHL